jgi:hypothetical protein
MNVAWDEWVVMQYRALGLTDEEIEETREKVREEKRKKLAPLIERMQFLDLLEGK